MLPSRRFRLTCPAPQYGASFLPTARRVALCVRAAAALTMNPELTYAEGLTTLAAPIPGLPLPPAAPEALPPPALPHTEESAAAAAAADAAERAGQPRPMREAELLREGEFLLGQMEALVGAGQLPASIATEAAGPEADPSAAEGSAVAVAPPGGGHFLSRLAARCNLLRALERGPRAPPPPPVRARAPPSLRTDFLAPQAVLPDLLMAWDFLQTYPLFLRLPPCPFSRFEAAYYAPSRSTAPGGDAAALAASASSEALMRDVHLSLLRIVDSRDVELRPATLRASHLSSSDWAADLVAEAAWPERTRRFAEAAGQAPGFGSDDAIAAAAAAMRAHGWWGLPPASRVALTCALVAAAASTEAFRHHLGVRFDVVSAAERMGRLSLVPRLPGEAGGSPGGSGHTTPHSTSHGVTPLGAPASDVTPEQQEELLKAASAALRTYQVAAAAATAASAAAPPKQAPVPGAPVELSEPDPKALAAAAAKAAWERADSAANAARVAVGGVWDSQCVDRCVLRHGKPVGEDALGRHYFELGGGAGAGMLFVTTRSEAGAGAGAAADATAPEAAHETWSYLQEGGPEAAALVVWLSDQPYVPERDVLYYAIHFAASTAAPLQPLSQPRCGDGYAELDAAAASGGVGACRAGAKALLGCVRLWGLAGPGLHAWRALQQDLEAAETVEALAAALPRLEVLLFESKTLGARQLLWRCNTAQEHDGERCQGDSIIAEGRSSPASSCFTVVCKSCYGTLAS